MDNTIPINNQTPQQSFLQSIKEKIDPSRLSKKTLGILVFILIAAAVPLTAYIAQQQTQTQQQAAQNGSVIFLDAATNIPIVQTSTPDIKLQLALPDAWELPQASTSGRFHLLPKAYAQTVTPETTVTQNPTPTQPIQITPTPQPAIVASADATLAFSPPSSTTTPIIKNINDDIVFDVFINPNTESVNASTLAISYDTTVLEAKKFEMAQGGFTQILAGPTLTNGTASITMTIGLDVNKILTTNNTKIATITFKALKATITPTKITFTSDTNVTSVTSPVINALKETPEPAFISINSSSLPSPTLLPLKKTLAKIIVKNTISGGDTERIIHNPQDILTVLNQGISWKLAPLPATETVAARSVLVTFEGTNSDSSPVREETTATIMLRSSSASTTITPSASPSATIDVLDYFLTKHVDKGLTGTHPLSQVIDGQKTYFMKWKKDQDPAGFSSVFEVYTWDENFIYLKEDHSGAPVNYYTFTPGTWMKRHMTIGEKVTVNNNTIAWYNPTCQTVPPPNQPFPIELTLERLDPEFAAGGDLGKQEVIVLKYDSSIGNPNGIYERFYYSREWGWILWEEYDKATNNKRNTSTFNRITNTFLRPLLSAACSDVGRTGSPSATLTPTIPVATPSGVLIPTMTLAPTATPIPGGVVFSIKLSLQGIGLQENTRPMYPQRDVAISLFDNNGNQVGTDKTGKLTYNQTSGLFEGDLDAGVVTPGNYTVKAKSGKYLRKIIANIAAITQGTSRYVIGGTPILVAGDLNNDNQLNIEDYNMYKDCLNKDTTTCITSADLNDDGETDTTNLVPKFLDYRLLIKNFSLQRGE